MYSSCYRSIYELISPTQPINANVASFFWKSDASLLTSSTGLGARRCRSQLVLRAIVCQSPNEKYFYYPLYVNKVVKVVNCSQSRQSSYCSQILLNKIELLLLF